MGTELVFLHQGMLATLQQVQHRRSTDDNWRENERRVMCVAVNHKRRQCGKRLLPLRDIIAAEGQALDDDYLDRFAMYCAELVLKP